MNERILCVDDEPNVLDGYRRSLRGKFKLETAVGGTEALQAIKSKGGFAVIVSDMRMPGMDGIQLLRQVKEQAPDTVRMMLTGNSDQETAMNAVNEGSIFRFLTKPCPPETFASALQAGIEQHRLITAEKELLNKTLRGSIKVLSDVLTLVNPVAFGHTSRIQGLVRKMAKQLRVEGDWRIELAAMLANIGFVTIPTNVCDKAYRGIPLTPEEQEMVDSHPAVAFELLKHIPRLEEVARIIAYQEKGFDGSGRPVDGSTGADIPLGSRILKVARDFDTYSARDMSDAEAMLRLRQKPAGYDPNVLSALEQVMGLDSLLEKRSVGIRELTAHMILAEPVKTVTGVILAPKGTDVTDSLRQRLNNFARQTAVVEPITVLVKPGF